MENYSNEQSQVDVPNSSLILAFGIVSIVGCCCSNGILGVIFGIVALVMAKSAGDLYLAHPEKYTESSYKNVNTGKICAWVGLIPSILLIILLAIAVMMFGWSVLSDPSAIYEHFGVQAPF
jgi:uncharacterized membrane protein